MTLVESKSIHRNRENKIEAERNLRIERKREKEGEQDCPGRTVNIFVDLWATIELNIYYIGVPMIKVLPSVLFRLLTFWLILSYCAQIYPHPDSTSPGWGLIVPAFLPFFIVLINFLSGYLLELNREEATVNSFSNLILPVYSNLFFLAVELQ